ncbi:DEAD/DEAH box helicase [Cohnella mopanensis]|uniref:DEAD/DEAH box helicase n=1 Tax=Cohnella mopanensis TaxID=2911966 RepID=UPI001EF7D8C8|nr:DEAD/DEAH box helicase [Cohnella mopanensis]
MKSGKWVLKDSGYICIITNDDETYYPSAEDIYFAQFRTVLIVNGIKVEKPSDDLSNIKFSKLPMSLKILLRQHVHENSISIQAEIISTHKKEMIKLNTILESGIDYILINDTWHPFVKGIFEEIKNLLIQAGIMTVGKITIKQYLYIRNTASHLLQDEVGTMLLDKNTILPELSEDIPLFVGRLYPYQYQGYRWLKMISEEEAGCILADEMGLGKTAQVIALLAYEKTIRQSVSLVIAPVTLMENWRRELEKFAPQLKVMIHQGTKRTGFYQNLQNYDVVITTYDSVLRDLSMIQMIKWNLVVLDEAQAIKNPSAKRTVAVKQVPRRVSIAVTGTPVENRLTDLWSITDFALPSFLGDLSQFQKKFSDDLDGAKSLEPTVSPIMLRRRVNEVAKDLPQRINIPQVLKMEKNEAIKYEMLRKQIIDEHGKNASLIALIKLRIYCTHPMLYSGKSEDPALFIKYMRMLEIIEEIIANKEKILIFTSFTKMSDILVGDLFNRFGIYCDFIDGRVPISDRQQKIDIYSKIEDSAILVLNPRAAGAGLNITAANHVIHYNLEWNPAIEDQASARSYRRGQTRPVNIYKLFYASTVEEAMNDRLERKRMVSETAIVGIDGSKNDYLDILKAMTLTPI